MFKYLTIIVLLIPFVGYSTKENKAAPPYAVGYSVKRRQATENNERREYMASPPKRLGSQGHDDENQPGVVSRPKSKSKANPKSKPIQNQIKTKQYNDGKIN